MLAALDGMEVSNGLHHLPEVGVLRRVWARHFEQDTTGPDNLRRLRAVDAIVAAGGLPAMPRPRLEAAPRQVLTPRTAAWAVLRRAEKRTVESQALLAGMRGRSPMLNEAVELAEAFISLVRGREAAELDPWLQRAQHVIVSPLQRFAKCLRADHDAVRAALSLGWSSGQTER